VAHIELDPGQPGILALFQFRPETAGPLLDLTNVLLRGPGSLPPGDRELIAAFVSRRNACQFCELSHGAMAAAQRPGGMAAVGAVLADPAAAAAGPKLTALLGIAAAVQHGGAAVTDGLVAAARAAGATDLELHDTVLIAATFCMLNRYVDGLGAPAPADPAAYAGMAEHITAHGYSIPADGFG
jgi:uncharacterized peroxidase-related enzyme